MNKLYIEEYGSPRSTRPLLAAQPARARKPNPKSVGSKFLPSSVSDIELRSLSSPDMDIYRPETLHNSTRFAKFSLYSALYDRKVHTQNTRYLPYIFRRERVRNFNSKYSPRDLMATDHKCRFHGISRFQP